MSADNFVTRFAPSPTGPLHLGHAFSALLAFDMAKSASGKFLLRIEDIDQSRARAAWENQIYDDLHWLGLNWPEPVMRQSERMGAYRAALDNLWRRGLLYPCTCNRRDIAEALSAPQEAAVHHGPDGPVYPGTCRPAGNAPLPTGSLPSGVALRLNMSRARDVLRPVVSEGFISFPETGAVIPPSAYCRALTDLPTRVGDVVLARRDMGTAYHLSVVVDDAAQQITHVVRGADLAEATFIHVVLQKLLELPKPTYAHHKLIRDENGKRLAKRDDARAIARYRDDGLIPADIRALVGLKPPAS